MTSKNNDDQKKPPLSVRHLKIVKKRPLIDDENAAEIVPLEPPSDRPEIGTGTQKVGPLPINQNQPSETTRRRKWKPKLVKADMFPDRQGSKPPATVANVAYMLEQNGITVRYNAVKKKVEINIPGMKLTSENTDNVSLSCIHSLANLCGMPTGHIDQFIAVLADQNAYNPVSDWINQRVWDGKDRLTDFYGTLTTTEEFPQDLKRVLMRKWLLSGVAAALMPSGFRCRGVLTLQGPQGVGKTRWGKRLISDPLLANSVIKTDHHLDASNKDSLIIGVSHFIVEIGELESSFKKDVSRLKGFLTSDSDKVRLPYAKRESEYPRRTIFYATVNQGDFLIDNTGNSRWWSLPVVEVDHEHDIDMQQVFAQLAVEYEDGAEWWLTAEEEAQLTEQNKRHKSFSLVADKLSDVVDFDAQPTADDQTYTATELLEKADMDRPTNQQAKECGALLREAFGDPKRINGRDKWRVPLKDEWHPENNSDDRDNPKKDKFD